jgi:hypothetical protein
MNKATSIFLAIALAASLFGLAACDDKVSEEAAREAAKTLKKWQDQNRK